MGFVRCTPDAHSCTLTVFPFTFTRVTLVDEKFKECEKSDDDSADQNCCGLNLVRCEVTRATPYQ